MPVAFAQSTKPPWMVTADSEWPCAPTPHPSAAGVLFLPHEVFDQLIGHAFWGPAPICQRFRKGFMPEVKAHALPPDFWEQLRVITTIYVADLWARDDGDSGCGA